ncbi:mitochondrial mRNA pseudouridine synthase RPUSD3-like [Brevipalpus obovatus]|uniref:mitochondrial mRNA pseudouridine synthase RPUSD3-like n=1 Tax=Brevipalpus obovatus TaxID=246614 RepID=UPI003D9DD2E1
MCPSFLRRKIVSEIRIVSRGLQFQAKYRRTDHDRTDYTHPENHIYHKIYPWKNLDDFIQYLSSNVLYNDGKIIAVHKPFGVGTYFPNAIIKRITQIDPERFGDVRYCLKDALPGLASALGVPELRVGYTTDRTVSGIALLGVNQRFQKKISRKVHVAKLFRAAPMQWLCLTSGIPNLKAPTVTEKVGIQKIVLDPRTSGKDFEIVYNPTKNFLKKDNVKSVRAQISILEENRSLKSAFVSINCSKTEYNFLTCYLASKQCFVLGDLRFSNRVGQVFGVPISMPPRSFGVPREPLPKSMAKRLSVDSNRSIPLLLHQKKLCLYNYPVWKKTVVIENPKLPNYFDWTLKQLF